jgi:type IV pilus assembly protein PilY1
LETLFRVEYNRENWSGNLHAYPLDAYGNLYASKRWSAATQLATQAWDTGRFIATLNSASPSAGVPFQGGALTSAVTVNKVNYSATQVLGYVRGDTSNDAAHGGQLRIRSSPLGDIVHSRPFYVDDATHPSVYVGANDGMLHAFNATTGAERWAYVPSMLLGKLHTLAYSTTQTSQTFKHDYYVDGQINVGTIRNSSGSSIRALFGGLGGGGKGLYALDISTLSDPANEASVASKILWEIAPNTAGTSSTLKRNGQPPSTRTDYSRMGYTYGTPLLVKVNTSAGPTARSVDALIVGNGFDDNAAGVAHLYVINAATGALMKDFAVGPYSGLGGRQWNLQPPGDRHGW